MNIPYILNEIKKNRTPKEVLEIIKILENPSNILHDGIYTYFRSDDDIDTLFTICDSLNTINYWNVNIVSYIHDKDNMMFPCYGHDVDINKFIEQAIYKSKYCNYRIT